MRRVARLQCLRDVRPKAQYGTGPEQQLKTPDERFYERQPERLLFGRSQLVLPVLFDVDVSAVGRESLWRRINLVLRILAPLIIKAGHALPQRGQSPTDDTATLAEFGDSQSPAPSSSSSSTSS